MPAILIFCLVGLFVITNSVFGIVIMLAMGFIAYIMEENGFPMAPTILGIVVGTMLEEMFLSSMIKADGDLSAFFSRPIAATFGTLTLMILLET